MEDRVDYNAKNTQENDSLQNSSVEQTLKKSKVVTLLYACLVLLVLLLVSTILIFFQNRKKIPLQVEIAPPTVTETPSIPTDNVFPDTPVAEENTGISSTSYGIFYPYSDGATTNNTQPTIIGKISQTNKLLLETKFGKEESPVSMEDEYFLRFVPGKVKNLEVTIDGIAISDVYGISQYPTVSCQRINLNPDGTASYDSETGEKSPPDDIFTTEAECISEMSAEVPPLIFFTRPGNQLTQGEHTLTISIGGKTAGFMVFTVDNSFSLPAQAVVESKSGNYSYNFDIVDNCTDGYYYDKNSMKMPLPITNNKNLFFGLSFPQTDEEHGSIKRRQVQIGFEGSRFDLFFPGSFTFFDGKSFKNNNLKPEKALFLPKDHLFFTDGNKAEPQLYDLNDGITHGSYFEIFQVDASGREYRGYSLPWETSGSSSCDG